MHATATHKPRPSSNSSNAPLAIPCAHPTLLLFFNRDA